nr:MAG TPA: hypothetical protein [Caudoviricetes sp.]
MPLFEPLLFPPFAETHPATLKLSGTAESQEP